MLDVNKLIASAEACLGWPYASPGSNDARGIDCSGLFVKCFRDQGAKVYHGSNTIWRKYCSEKGELKSIAQLKPGMAVFKWKPGTPSKFKDAQGDFHHIGLVTSVSPLRIIHASSVAGRVICDSRIGKWAYWGWLKEVEKTECASAPAASAAVPEGDPSPRVKIISAGGNVNIRKGNELDYACMTSVAPGTILDYVAAAANGWYAVKIGMQIGWVSPDFAALQQGA